MSNVAAFFVVLAFVLVVLIAVGLLYGAWSRRRYRQLRRQRRQDIHENGYPARIPLKLLSRVNKWRNLRYDNPGTDEAIQHLVRRGLEVESREIEKRR